MVVEKQDASFLLKGRSIGAEEACEDVRESWGRCGSADLLSIDGKVATKAEMVEPTGVDLRSRIRSVDGSDSALPGKGRRDRESSLGSKRKANATAFDGEGTGQRSVATLYECERYGVRTVAWWLKIGSAGTLRLGEAEREAAAGTRRSKSARRGKGSRRR